MVIKSGSREIWIRIVTLALTDQVTLSSVLEGILGMKEVSF